MCWWQAEIERLQSELASSSRQCQTSSSSELTASDDTLARETDSGTESQQLTDSLKCQLQQITLTQQTTNMQLAAIKQVSALRILAASFHYLFICQVYDALFLHSEVW